ncbi:MAG TPA: DUF3999 family protein [Candidatus Acidoferrum sp.]|nr:DUF3999 family protein [Candidatus Acidoferrum sp.]
MIRRSPLLLVALTFAALSLLATDLPGRWRAWRYSRAVLVESVPAPSPTEVFLPWVLISHCSANCADLRLLDDRGQEVPFELSVDRGDFHSETYGTKLVENSFVNGQYTQLIADAGKKPPLYDQVGIDTDKGDFIVWAEVALSDDARTWRVVVPRAPIARFRSRSVDGTQTIPFQGLNSRYIRIRIFEPETQFPVSGVRVVYQVSRAAQRSEIPANFSPVAVPSPGESAWLADLNSGSLPVSQVCFSTNTQEFYRAVRVSESTDGKQWSYVSSGTIYRYAQGDQVRESLQLDFPETYGMSHFRVEVVDGDDQPLSNVVMELCGIQRKILFVQQPGRAYRVLYGNEKARAPQYDLKYYLASGPEKTVYKAFPLGHEEITANYADPRPFTERHPILLWLALAIAVVLLGYTAMRTLRSPASASK